MADVDSSRITQENKELRREIDELALLNDLAIAIGSARDLDTIIRTLVKRSLEIIGAGQGVVTLLRKADGASGSTLVRTVVGTGSGAMLRPDEALLAWMSHHKKPIRLQDPSSDEVFGSFEWDPSVQSVLCIPLMVQGRLLGVLTLFNNKGGDGFTEADSRLLTILGMQSAQIIEAALAQEERDRVLNVFGRHTAPTVVEELLRYDTDPPSRRVEVCVMFLDLRGFTSFAEQAQPEEVVDYLNAFFAQTTEAVTSRGGIIHQLLGDGFMAVFGAPIAHEDDSTRAVDAALDIVQRIDVECSEGRLRPTRLGIGLHTGEVVAGTVGSSQHKEYKITGDVVNVAARIEGLCKEYDARLLVSQAVWERQSGDRQYVDNLGPVSIRGRSEPLGLVKLA